MNAQITISTINTVLTAIFVAAMGLPHLVVAVGLTFLCGFLPVIGNLISNTLVVALVFIVIASHPPIVLLTIFGGYALWSPLVWLWRRMRRSRRIERAVPKAEH